MRSPACEGADGGGGGGVVVVAEGEGGRSRRGRRRRRRPSPPLRRGFRRRKFSSGGGEKLRVPETSAAEGVGAGQAGNASAPPSLHRGEVREENASENERENEREREVGARRKPRGLHVESVQRDKSCDLVFPPRPPRRRREEQLIQGFFLV